MFGAGRREGCGRSSYMCCCSKHCDKRPEISAKTQPPALRESMGVCVCVSFFFPIQESESPPRCPGCEPRRSESRLQSIRDYYHDAQHKQRAQQPAWHGRLSAPVASRQNLSYLTLMCPFAAQSLVLWASKYFGVRMQEIKAESVLKFAPNSSS